MKLYDFELAPNAQRVRIYLAEKGLEVPMTLLLFLAAEEDDLKGFTPELKEKLSAAALNLMRESA